MSVGGLLEFSQVRSIVPGDYTVDPEETGIPSTVLKSNVTPHLRSLAKPQFTMNFPNETDRRGGLWGSV